MRRLLVLLSLLLAGCATSATLTQLQPGSPKIYSGTRLDFHAVADNREALARFPVPPLDYPLPAFDLPLSFILDTVLLPFTLGATAYEAVFGDLVEETPEF